MAINSEDAPALQKLAHSLKGSSAHVGAQIMAECCKEMEMVGRANTTVGGRDLLLRIEREYSLVRDTLQREL